eukprot:GEMP01117508.1.p2 GENE.GEMP01117508.1~~GEMP01117508.1.p2  ORF type:complete len:135 (-),score=9.49 GEMP01117508.1:162-566(-)
MNLRGREGTSSLATIADNNGTSSNFPRRKPREMQGLELVPTQGSTSKLQYFCRMKTGGLAEIASLAMIVDNADTSCNYGRMTPHAKRDLELVQKHDSTGKFQCSCCLKLRGPAGTALLATGADSACMLFCFCHN